MEMAASYIRSKQGERLVAKGQQLAEPTDYLVLK